MLTLSHVCKRYPGGIEALRDVSLAIERGQLVLVEGDSGAGKSTLLRLLGAIELPSSGSVLVDGQNTRALGRRALAALRRQFGVIFQDQKLLFDRSAFENVMLPLDIGGFERREAQRRARAALDKVGLLHKEKALPVALSGGEQQRLCIARAIVHRPRVIVADEPTGNLDETHAQRVLEMLDSFNALGVTMIVSTHDRMARERLDGRRIRLQAGTLSEASAAVA
ncbi:MAG: ATP-binding cassette domain-containing protein [Burkholderiales bacterium]|nr:ATP-binding cassette domain-containing protein [Burkholderiales bacterium]